MYDWPPQLYSSLVLVGEAAKNGPGDHVAAEVDGGEGGHARRSLAIGRNLAERVALRRARQAPALVVAVLLAIGGRLLVQRQRPVRVDVLLVRVELVVHERLVAVLEDGQVLELLEEDGDVVRADEEAGEQHERDDQHRRQRHRQLLVREAGRDDQRIARAGIVDQHQDAKEHHEGAEVRVVADSVVDDAAEDDWGHDGEGELGDDFGPEVWARLVHVVIDLSKEHGTLVWEDQNNILDSVEGDVHGDEEERALDVLDTGLVGLGVKEEENGCYCDNMKLSKKL